MPGMPSAAVYCVNAFLLSLVLILAMEKVATRIGLVDVPSERKTHEGRIPLVGAAIFLAFFIAANLLHRQPAGFANLLMSLLLIVSLGVLDDLIDLRAPVKLVAQCLCVAPLALNSELLIRNAGMLFTDHPLLLFHWAIPVTIFSVVGLVNAINMIDGLDGLAGGVSLMAFTWFAVAAAALGLYDVLLLILVLDFSVLGFLVFNLRHPWRARASVFLGDGGSMMLGLSLAFPAISLSQSGGGSLSPVAVLWIFALPVIDTLSLMVRRLTAGQGVLASDHRHLHDLMMKAGLSVSQTVLVLVAISGLLGGIGIGGWLFGLPDRIMLLGLAAPILLHTWFCCYGWHHMQSPPRPFAASGEAISQLESATGSR
jgi:UDP-GlcNAc:undecaprenyl-phosphate GlcNAc-1-phosphate transferase